MVCFNYIWGAVYSWLVSTFICVYIYIYIYIVKFSTLHKLWDFSYIIRQRSFFISFVIHWDINPEILLLGHEVCWKTLWHFLFFFVLLIFLGTCSFLNLNWMCRCVFCLWVICLLYCSSFHKWTCGDIFYLLELLLNHTFTSLAQFYSMLFRYGINDYMSFVFLLAG